MIARLLTIASIFVVPPSAQIRLTLDRALCLPFQPLFLQMEATAPDIPLLDLHDGRRLHRLQISRPDGTMEEYHPPMTLLSIAPSNRKIVFETLVLSSGRAIAERPGVYHLLLTDRDGNQVSNQVSFRVREPIGTAEREARDSIQARFSSWSLYVYLEGGDHLHGAGALVDFLSGGNTEYALSAKWLRAMNLCQKSWDWEADSLRREVSIISLKVRIDELSLEALPDYSLLRLSHGVASRVPGWKEDPTVSRDIARMHRRLAGTPARFMPSFEELTGLLTR